MIYEYVIDPDLILQWGNSQRDYAEFVQAFGIGSPRAVSDFPRLKKWRRLVLSRIPLERQDTIYARRVTELVQALAEARVTRDSCEFRDTDDWCERIESEHTRAAFDHIFMSDTRPLRTRGAFFQDDIYQNGEAHWLHADQVHVHRVATEMADAIANMLRLANRIVIVDPYVRVSPGKLNPVREYVQRALTRRVNATPPIVEVLFDSDSDRAPQARSLYEGIENYLGENRARIRLKVKSLERIPSGEGLHNRYILTELGGVSFGWGTDEGERETTDDITLLSKERYEHRWRQYADCRAFNVFQEFPPPGRAD